MALRAPEQPEQFNSLEQDSDDWRNEENVTRFTSHLVAIGLLSEENKNRIVSQVDQSGLTVNAMAVQAGLVSEIDMAKAVADFFNFKRLDMAKVPSENILAARVMNAFVKMHQIAAIEENDEEIKFALVNPLDTYVVEAIKFAIDKDIQIVIATSEEIQIIHRSIFTNNDESNLNDLAGTQASEVDVEKLKSLATEAPVIKLVNQLIQRAVVAGASDIHFDPDQNGIQVRNRIDGILHFTERVPDKWKSALVSRIKLIAELDIAERRLAQDGRINTMIAGRDLDIRVATAPTMHGESVVLRILDKTRLTLQLEVLGYQGVQLQKIRQMSQLANGLVLVTGPTGSGKTTTLYALLSELNDGKRKILTVEDPVEYLLPNVNQIQVKSSIDLTFAKALRSFLRHDPDVIMVGEIRDQETAQVAIQAALTGHLVLATMHTNDSLGAVTRFIDMGIDPFLVSSTLSGVIAQRLVRRLCQNCKTETLNNIQNVTMFKENASYDMPHFIAEGCDQCMQTGYQGRTSVVEILTIDDEIRQIIAAGANKKRLTEAAIKSGWESLYDNGLSIVRQGLSDIHEVNRVLRS